MDTRIFSGCLPALMTPCTADRTPDFDALVGKGQQLVDAGMAGVVYCGSMGDWPLLTDNARQTGVKQLCDAGVPVVVGTGAVNTQSAVGHAAHAWFCPGGIGWLGDFPCAGQHSHCPPAPGQRGQKVLDH